MIATKDRSYYIGASDTDKVMGKWTSDTFAKWWLQKIAINKDHFENKYTSAGTHYEHRILEAIGIPMVYDSQLILEDLRLRVNLDGQAEDCIYEVKTYKLNNGFIVPKKYVNQVQVQMFAYGIHRAEIVAYGLHEKDYDNYFNPIEGSRLSRHQIPYNREWVETAYLPRLRRLADCLKEGRFPCE